ncbi:MAG: 3-deoxy-8-phosphooctulonate synthase [Bacteriovoracaceae bacterium]|nr:3-deoxy-8-phosphooctulonate synthase [Bacteriovoracaceae bacterium]
MRPNFKFFLGPCVLESEALVAQTAQVIKSLQERWQGKATVTYKGSFDKANRTSLDAFRGPGLEKGLAWLQKVKTDFNLAVMTDFHTVEQAEPVAQVCDVIQVPAFLCRQTDLILAGAKAALKHGRVLNIKKGQFISPMEVAPIVKKAASILPREQIMITERGSSFGYQNLVVDMSSFALIQQNKVAAIFDATHSVQMPGGLGHATAGKRELMPYLAKAAVAAGADGVFMEVHPCPEKALSDATTCWPLDQVAQLGDKLLQIFAILRS